MNVQFPDPITISGRNYWQRGDVRRWLAAVAGKSEPSPLPNDEGLLTARAVRELCGDVSAMWLWRRRRMKSQNDAAA